MARLMERIKDESQLVLEKNGMQIVVPTGLAVVVSKQRKYDTMFFAGILPARIVTKGKNKVFLQEERVLGLAEWSVEEERFIQDSIRVVRFGKMSDEQRKYVVDILRKMAKWLEGGK